jgi:hypothetical protein
MLMKKQIRKQFTLSKLAWFHCSWHAGLAAVAALLVIAAAAPRAHAQSGEPVHWDLASDFRLAPDQGNPNPDGYGNADVWYFLQGIPGVHDPSTYTLLPEFIDDAFHVPKLEQWQGTFISGDEKDKLPAIGVNATGQNFGDWPAHKMRVHPLSTLTAIVGWQSPIGGSAFIRARFADIGLGCGDGIGWAIDKDTLTIASGSFGDGGHQSFNGSVTLQEGDFLYFIVDDGGGFGYDCDSTELDLTIVKGTPSWAPWY